MSHFLGHFEGASTFLTPKLSLAALRTIEGVKKVLAPSKCPSIWLIKLLYHKKIMSRSFLNSGTLIVINPPPLEQRGFKLVCNINT
jgi:hypothetical protein